MANFLLCTPIPYDRGDGVTRFINWDKSNPKIKLAMACMHAGNAQRSNFYALQWLKGNR